MSKNYELERFDTFTDEEQGKSSQDEDIARKRSNSAATIRVFAITTTLLIIAVLFIISFYLTNYAREIPENISADNIYTSKPKVQSKVKVPAAHLFNGMYSAYSSESYNWVHGSEDGLYFESKNEQLYLTHIETKNSKLLMKAPSSDLPNLYNPVASKDLKKVLLSANTQSGWRHSFFADYWIYDVEGDKFTPMTSYNRSSDDSSISKVALALWSPTGHSIAWVRDNNIFAKPQNGDEVQITFDGSPNIMNGIADWVYEEEMFSSNEAMWFSANSSMLLYIKFNDTLVKSYDLQYFMDSKSSPYPHLVPLKYPKPGTPNPSVSIHIYDFFKQKEMKIDFETPAFDESDFIISEVTWFSDNSLLLRIMNRVQDYQKIYLVTYTNEDSFKAKLVRDEPSPDQAWYNWRQPLYKLGSGQNNSEQSYLELMEDSNGYAHIAYFKDINLSKPTEWLTSGDWEVTKINGYDEENQIIYYTSTEKGSTQRHIYSISINEKVKRLLSFPKKLDKDIPLVPFENLIINQSLNDSGFFQASFSPRCKYYSMSYLGPDVPFNKVVHSKTQKIISEYQNENLRKDLLLNQIPAVRHLSIKNDDGINMDCKLILPYDFDSSGATKYPVFMEVYGGPTSQKITQAYQIDFMTGLAASNIVVLIVDGRGSGFRGRAYRSAVSKQLGKFETLDQIAGARWLSKQPYIDSQRIGTWGWSYGGYLASKIIEAQSDVIKFAVAVAPVTDWKLYDTMYTERYMKTVEMNPNGYLKSAVSNMDEFKKKKFLLIHGTGDDNVHFHNTARLLAQLTSAGVKSYRVQIYTDSDHSMNKFGARGRLMDLLKDTISDQFKIKL